MTRAVVTVGIEKHGFEMLGIEDAFAGLIDLDHRSPHGNRRLTLDDVRDVQPRGGSSWRGRGVLVVQHQAG